MGHGAAYRSSATNSRRSLRIATTCAGSHHLAARWSSCPHRAVAWRTPTSSSWLNLVERFFADLTEECVREGSFRGVRQLIKAIEEYMAARNDEPKRYVWRAEGQQILAKIQRARAALAQAVK